MNTLWEEISPRLESVEMTAPGQLTSTQIGEGVGGMHEADR